MYLIGEFLALPRHDVIQAQYDEHQTNNGRRNHGHDDDDISIADCKAVDHLHYIPGTSNPLSRTLSW